MFSNPDGITNNSPMEVSVPDITKNPIPIKLFNQFSDLFYVKQKTDVLQLGSTKKNNKETRNGNSLWFTIQNWKWYIKIKTNVKNVCIV